MGKRMINQNLKGSKIDWTPLFDRVQPVAGKSLPAYPGDLKMALLTHARLSQGSQGEAMYQLAVEISRLSTCCDPEVIYWFSRLVELNEIQ